MVYNKMKKMINEKIKKYNRKFICINGYVYRKQTYTTVRFEGNTFIIWPFKLKTMSHDVGHIAAMLFV